MAAPLVPEDDDILKDDYYALLNVTRDAKKEEINQAYKQLSKIYHPDKHQDPLKKKNAEFLFSKLKRAHEVLIDEHRRTIYDLYGEKGLESYGMEVISRTKTPAEIIAEYERFKEEQADMRLQQRTNPKSSAMIAINATDLFESFKGAGEDEDTQSFRLPNIEISSMDVHQSVECPLTTQNTGILTWDVSTQNGNASGVFVATWKRFMSSRGHFEVDAIFGSKYGAAFRCSRNIFQRCTLNFSTKIISTDGYRFIPNVGAGLVYTFDNHWQGRIRYNCLPKTSLSTVMVYNTETQQIVFQIMLSIQNCYVFTSYTRKFKEYDASTTVALKVGTLGAVFEYGVEKKISQFSVIEATVSVGIPTGVNLRLKLDRGQHSFVVPISLSEEILPSSVFYGTIVPIIVYFAVKKMIVDPFLSQQREKDLERKKQEQNEKIQKRKKEAQALMELMKETVERSIEVEEKRNGLIILSAIYGKLSASHQSDLQNEDCIDVTVPVQALVKDSKLISPEKNSKSDLPGFFDPCIGEEKKLYIKYKFRRKLHHTTVEDKECIRLPQQKHLVREEEEEPFQVSEVPDT